jgi:hypothetical protein
MQDGALVLVRSDWPGLRLYHLLHEDEPRSIDGMLGLLGQATVEANGLTIKSSRPNTEHFKFSQVRVLIPWRYVESIVWHEDIGGVATQLGFVSAQK